MLLVRNTNPALATLALVGIKLYLRGLCMAKLWSKDTQDQEHWGLHVCEAMGKEFVSIAGIWGDSRGFEHKDLERGGQGGEGQT